jgi:hypothetical protein
MQLTRCAQMGTFQPARASTLGQVPLQVGCRHRIHRHSSTPMYLSHLLPWEALHTDNHTAMAQALGS